MKKLVTMVMLFISSIITANASIPFYLLSDYELKIIESRIHLDSLLNSKHELTHQEQFILSFYEASLAHCETYKVDPILCLAQAISEQGWKIRSDYRIFNVRMRNGRYKTYKSLDAAIEDYCKVIARYNTVDVKKICKKYAEAPHYYKYVRDMYKRVNTVIERFKLKDNLIRYSF